MGLLRLLKYLLLMLLAVGIVTLSLANRGPMTLQLLPDDLAAFLGFNLTVVLPVFLVILAGVAAGLLIGFVWEWLREHRLRADAARSRAEMRRLKQRMAAEAGTALPARSSDDVLALIERAPSGRAAR